MKISNFWSSDLIKTTKEEIMKEYRLVTTLIFKSGAKTSYLFIYSTEEKRDTAQKKYLKEIAEALTKEGIIILNDNIVYRAEDVSYFICEKG